MLLVVPGGRKPERALVRCAPACPVRLLQVIRSLSCGSDDDAPVVGVYSRRSVRQRACWARRGEAAGSGGVVSDTDITDLAGALELVGPRIRRWRLRRGYTQDQVASAIGITQTALSHYETGKRRLLLSTTVALAGVLDVPIGELVVAGLPGEWAIPRRSRLGRLIEDLLERPELLKALGDAGAMLPLSSLSQSSQDGGATSAMSAGALAVPSGVSATHDESAAGTPPQRRNSSSHAPERALAGSRR